MIAGVAGLVAGAMSMAAGEYVSVSSQADSEQADLARERKELSENPVFELDELADIYVTRGVDRELARQVARQLMAKDALTAHARDELGISEITTPRPVQAALTSALSFSVGAAMPLLMVVVSPAAAQCASRPKLLNSDKQSSPICRVRPEPIVALKQSAVIGPTTGTVPETGGAHGRGKAVQGNGRTSGAV